VLSYLRIGPAGDLILVVCNLTPVLRTSYRVGVPVRGHWRELLNSDADVYGGTGAGNFGGVAAGEVPWHGRPCSLELTLPPLAVLIFKSEPSAPAQAVRESAGREANLEPWAGVHALDSAGPGPTEAVPGPTS
jgi:hypothetical protein